MIFTEVGAAEVLAEGNAMAEKSNTELGRVAVVTGANRGLGLETCRQLAGRGYRVVLTARGQASARNAAEEIGVDHVQLDVTDKQSIARAASEIRERYERVDVLVNNAGVALRGFDESIAKTTIGINVFGPIAVTDALVPLLSEHASVVMVSSGLGDLSCVSAALREQFEDPRLARDRLTDLMQQFIQDVSDGTHAANGWPGSAYNVSKVGLNAFTRLLAREFEATTSLRVNAVCPGWAQTDMGGAGASRSVEEGARSIVWAATLGDEGPSGGFFRDGAAVSW